MLILAYNILLTLSLVLLLPVLMLIMLRAKYRGRTFERLGLKTGLISSRGRAGDRPVIWIHALSVGEVTSALPLVRGIQEELNSAGIIFTAATRSGRDIAATLLKPWVDLVLSGPFDLPFAVRRYLDAVRPDLFILIETDFWPNWLYLLKQRNIPVMLVNGRVSTQSFAAYTRFAFFFKPMFRCFDLLSMQTAVDRERMIELGIPPEKVVSLGNLKYDLPEQAVPVLDLPVRTAGDHSLIWVCGSTHAGEEELLLTAYTKLRNENLLLIIAPRDISRGRELIRLARSMHFTASARSEGAFSAQALRGSVFILDTIGELAGCYGSARLAFIGGSLVAEGGHNPLEAAVQGVPILFGPHMEDFSEIARDLTACGGARIVSAETLAESAAAILCQDDLYTGMSLAALHLVKQHRGGVTGHLQAINKLLHD